MKTIILNGNRMSIQATLDGQAINKLPKIAELIKAAAKFEANQMTNKTIRNCLNSRIAIDKMNDKELNDFQDDLITTFKYFNWLKDAKI